MKKLLYFMYAIVCYAIFFATFLYLIGFVENVSRFSFGQQLAPLFAKTLDTGHQVLPVLPALLIDLLLIALFGAQHSVMARPAFKKQWTKIVPTPIERSTYVLLASLALIVLFYCWQPIQLTLWDLSHSLVGDVFFFLSLLGWVLLLISTFLINHFDLFGLRQVYLYGRENKKSGKLAFRAPGFYKLIRHPIYFSFLVAFWFAPVMTLGHLVFTLGMTTYIFIGIYHEERDLMHAFGDTYRAYRSQVPKIIPFTRATAESEPLGQNELAK